MRVSFDEFSQEPSGPTAELIAAGEPGGPLDGLIDVAGYGDLLGTYDERPYWEFKDTINLSWRHNSFEVMLSGRRVSEFIQLGVTDNAKSVDLPGSSNDIYACSGILYNHESPRRNINFVNFFYTYVFSISFFR